MLCASLLSKFKSMIINWVIIALTICKSFPINLLVGPSVGAELFLAFDTSQPGEKLYEVKIPRECSQFPELQPYKRFLLRHLHKAFEVTRFLAISNRFLKNNSKQLSARMVDGHQALVNSIYKIIIN